MDAQPAAFTAAVRLVLVAIKVIVAGLQMWSVGTGSHGTFAVPPGCHVDRRFRELGAKRDRVKTEFGRLLHLVLTNKIGAETHGLSR